MKRTLTDSRIRRLRVGDLLIALRVRGGGLALIARLPKRRKRHRQ